MKIYDDVLPDDLLKECILLFCEDNMLWRLGKGVAYTEVDKVSRNQTLDIAKKNDISVIPDTNNVYMTNNLYDMYDGYQKLYEGIVKDIQHSIHNKLNVIIWMRFKLNLMFCEDKPYVYGFHNDCVGWLNDKLPHTTAVLYLDDSDGGTMFADGTFVQSKKNRLVVFPNTTLHSSVSQTDSNIRTLINFNFITGEEV
jgi:hypothetical protein